jgi:signal transduction histidine kinase
MLRTVSWLVRLTALAVVGVTTFVHSPASAPVLAAQAAAFVLGTAGLSVYAIIDYRFPPAARHVRLLPAALALTAAAGGVCASPHGPGLIAFGLIATLAAGTETGLATSWVITGIGGVAIEIGVLVWSASIAFAFGYPLLLIVALLGGLTRRSYRVQAEQSAALLAQVEQLRAGQREVAVLNERNRIAREIHDVLAHSLGALGIQIQTARAVLSDQRDIDRALGILEQAQRISNDGLGETRRAIHALRSDARPLAEELSRLAETHRARHHAAVTVNVDGDARTLPPDAALALLRTAQESLVNAAKHAGGGLVGISLRFGADQTTLTVTSPLPGDLPPEDMTPGDRPAGEWRPADHGAQLTAGPMTTEGLMKTADSGYGLVGMRERLLLLGGTLTAGPRDGQWIVTAQVPR